jgi:acetyl esterase/lipase
MSIALLLGGVFVLIAGLMVVPSTRPPGWLLIPKFLFGWLAGELALQWIATFVVFAAALSYAGALDESSGRIGLAAGTLGCALIAIGYRRSLAAPKEVAAGLSPLGLEAENRDISRFHGFWKPFGFSDPAVQVIRNIEYGESLPGDQGGRNLLDLYLPAEPPRNGERRPVLLQVHGGAWMIGDKREQGIPLMTHLAKRGWVCVASNYRLSPKATMPDHIIDVKRAIAWIRREIEGYGGDPEFLCITGGSAGGHLTALAALTANDPAFQPGFPEVDTRLDAAVPYYGVFDFVDRAGDRGEQRMGEAIGPKVFKSLPSEAPELWDAVSPITRIHAEAPPFLIIQGSHDTLVFDQEATTFVGALREKSAQPVAHIRFGGAQHAFDIFHSYRSAHAVRATTAFLENTRADFEARRPRSE